MSPSAPVIDDARAREKLAVLALSLGAFAMALNANVLAALLPFLGELDLDMGRKGLILGCAGVGGAVGSLLLGPVADRFGRRMPMILGMGLFVLASFAHLLATDQAGLIWARTAAGFAGGIVFTSASASVADLVPYERRGKAMGVFSAGMFLGLPAGLPLAQVLADQFGWWQGIYLLQGVVGILALVLFVRALPKSLGQGSNWTAGLPQLFRLEILASLLSVLLYVGAFFTCVQFSGDWLAQSGIVPKSYQWIVWMVLGFGSALGALGLTRFADRLGKHTFTVLTTTAVAGCVFALTLVGGLATLLLVGIPLAVISAARTGAFQALISEMVPQNVRGSLMGLRATFVNLGTGLFPLLAGSYASSGEGGFRNVAQVAAGAILVSALLVVFLVKRR